MAACLIRSGILSSIVAKLAKVTCFDIRQSVHILSMAYCPRKGRSPHESHWDLRVDSRFLSAEATMSSLAGYWNNSTSPLALLVLLCTAPLSVTQASWASCWSLPCLLGTHSAGSRLAILCKFMFVMSVSSCCAILCNLVFALNAAKFFFLLRYSGQSDKLQTYTKEVLTRS